MHERTISISDADLISMSGRLPKARPDHLAGMSVEMVVQENNPLINDSTDVVSVAEELAGHLSLNHAEMLTLMFSFPGYLEQHALDNFGYLNVAAGQAKDLRAYRRKTRRDFRRLTKEEKMVDIVFYVYQSSMSLQPKI